jgi:hypothetical protein
MFGALSTPAERYAAGKPNPGWPKTFEGAASEPVFGPDGTVYTSLETTSSRAASDSILAFSPDGAAKPGWPVTPPDGRMIVRDPIVGSAAAPDPPEIAPDGTVYVGTEDAEYENGSLDAFDASGRTRPGFPVAVDWTLVSNIFFAVGPGTGWYEIGTAGLVYLTDGYTVRAIGPNGQAAPGWPIKIPDGMIVTALEPEPDGGLMLEALQGGLADSAATGPLAFVGGAGGLPLVPDRALSVDFPGQLYVVRYLPDGSIAP